MQVGRRSPPACAIAECTEEASLWVAFGVAGHRFNERILPRRPAGRYSASIRLAFFLRDRTGVIRDSYA